MTAESDMFDWGVMGDRTVEDPQARVKYWNDRARKFLITDKECELCSGKLEWIGVQTFEILKYQCTECYILFNIRKDK